MGAKIQLTKTTGRRFLDGLALRPGRAASGTLAYSRVCMLDVSLPQLFVTEESVNGLCCSHGMSTSLCFLYFLCYVFVSILNDNEQEMIVATTKEKCTMTYRRTNKTL